MNAVFEALADPTTRNWYMGFCFALMVLPMAGLSWWYHGNIGKSEGGRRLMERQARTPPIPRGTLGQAQRNLGEAAGMARDIASGTYGERAHKMQNRVYWIAGLWVLANVLAFGILIWADEVNRSGS